MTEKWLRAVLILSITISFFVALFLIIPPYPNQSGQSTHGPLLPPINGLSLLPEITDFPLPKIENFDDPLIPQKVKEASKKKVKIKVFFIKDSSPIYQSYSLKSFNGSGFLVEDKNKRKIVLTARHVIFGDRNYPPPGSPLSVSPDGLSSIGNYQYRAYALDGAGIYKLAQLKSDATEGLDIAGFRLLEGQEAGSPVKLAKNAYLGETVYISGFGAQGSPNFPGTFFDIIEGPYAGRIDGIIRDGRRGEFFSKKLYRIQGMIEYGFSGGFTLNANGEVIGMSVMTSPMRNFAFIISSEDLEEFVNSLK